MNFEQLIQIVIGYAAEYKCTIAESINDLEFDGPNGSEGPSREDTIRLLNHFNERSEMLVSLDPNGGVCYYYSEKYIAADDALAMLDELSA
jgi:hypothetical protein